MSVGPQLPFSEELHAGKYRGPLETFRDLCYRVAGATTDNDEHFSAFSEILLSMRYLPAGRVQNAMGALLEVTPYNCYVSGTIEDSMVEGNGSIMQRVVDAAGTMRMGGGIGYDFSTLRPYKDIIKSQQTYASGPVSFMEVFNATCKTIASAGHRRGAQMAVLRVDHPDIELFINAKHPTAETQALWEVVETITDPLLKARAAVALQATLPLTAFNMSIAITDEFMECLAAQKPFPLRFGGQVYRHVDPVALYDMIMRSTWDWAEPGVLFIDTINRMNNLYYCETIAATNPCVRGDTPILTDQGYIDIESIVGQEVNVWNGFEFSKVTPTVTGIDQEMLSVELSDGSSIDCTPYHRFVIEKKGDIFAEDLAAGDRLIKHDWPVIDVGVDVGTAYEQGFFSGDGWAKQGTKNYIGLYGEKKDLEHLFTPLTSHEYDVSGGFEGTSLDDTRIFLYYGKNGWRKTFVPNVDWSVKSRLAWFAGLMDSDGCAVRSDNSVSLQVMSKDRDFLFQVKLLLNTLGTSGVLSNYREHWRLSISPNNVRLLEGLGLKTHRVDLSDNNPARNASRFVAVRSINQAEQANRVYCFTEPLRNTAIFGGIITGQCGEQPLPPYGACLLGSMNLVKYITKERGARKVYFDWDQFAEDIPHIVRAMDNVIDRAKYPMYEQKKEAHSKRRMGIGVTGTANAIEALGFPYGSPNYVKYKEKILDRLNNECYLASIELAKEKGSFRLFDAQHYLAGEYIQGLREDIRDGIAKHGIRNSHLTSIAPTGTISLCADNVSSGIEPVFDYSFERKINTADGPRVERVEDYGLRVFGTKGNRSKDVTIQEHLDVLIAASERVDSAVSKTCNIPGGTSWDDFKAVYLQAWERGAKGCTTFRTDGKRTGIFTITEEDNSIGEENGVACYVDEATGQHECE